jgi:hypothetical protein
VTDREWQTEWDQLVNERAAARRRWARSVEVVAVKARDPLGVKTIFKRHPVLASGVAAGLGALLVKTLLGAARRPREEDADRPPSNWSAALKTVAMNVATPLLTHFLSSRLDRFVSRASHRADDEAPADLNGRDATSPRS